MADNVSDIGSDGGDDYSSIAAWESATDNDLVTATTREIGELRGENFAEAIVIQSATTDADYYRWLRSMTGEEFDHTAETGARVVLTGSALTNLCTLRENYVRLGGAEGSSSGSIGFKLQTSGSLGDGVLLGFTGYTNQTYSQCVVYQSSSSSDHATGIRIQATPSTINNCLVYDISSGGSGDARGMHILVTTTIINCTVYEIDGTGGDDGYGIHSQPADKAVCYNCYVGGVTANDSAVVFLQCDGDYNSSDDATSPGANSIDNQAGADCFVSVAGGSEDFHLKAGSLLIDDGNDAYSNEFDIDGSVAGARDDMGCHEYVAAAAGGQPTMRRWGGVPGMALTGRVNW